MKTYRRHNCSSSHRTFRTLAKCMFPRAYWVQGEGPYATLAYCRVLTIELYETVEKAETAMRVINNSGCGGMCYRSMSSCSWWSHHKPIRGEPNTTKDEKGNERRRQSSGGAAAGHAVHRHQR